MSATAWKFVPVDLTDEMGEIIARRGRMCGGGAFELWDELIAAAPVPPSVESLLENWTPSDQQAFARFRDEHFPGEMDSYAIQSLGSAWKDGQANASTEVPQYTGTGSDSLDCILGVGGFASFGHLDAQPAHLTIPGALEWDGDNGTHGVVGTHSADGESALLAAAGEHVEEHLSKQIDILTINLNSARARLSERDAAIKEFIRINGMSVQNSSAHNKALLALAAITEPANRSGDTNEKAAYTAVDMATAAADGFRDGQTAATESLKAFANELIAAAFEGGSFDGGDIQDIAVKHGLLRIERRNEACGEVCGCTEYGFPARCYRKTDLLNPADESADPAKCESCGGWGHIETEDSAHDCPECGPSVVERAVEAGVMNAPKLYAADDIPDFTPGSGNKARRRIEAIQKAKPKTCIECDQPYCHGVCVERGDQDYGRDQAARGGDQ